MLKASLAFIFFALVLFLSLIGLVYDVQTAPERTLTSTTHGANHDRPNFQAILSDIFGPEVIEPPSTVKRLNLLDITLIIIALVSAVFMSVFAFVLAKVWLAGNKKS